MPKSGHRPRRQAPSGWSLLAGCLLFLLPGCAQRNVRVTGTVIRLAGNQMPSPDQPDPGHGGFATEVRFHLPASRQDARRAGPAGFYHHIATPLAARVATDAQGRFRLRIAPGRYSVFIAKDSLLYANIFDGEGVLNPVDIAPGRRTTLRLKADWDARY